MRAHKGILFILLLTLLAPGLLHAATAPKRVLTIVCEPTPPYEYEKDGTPAGINIEVMGKILDSLDIPYTFKFYPFARGWMMIKNGSADAIPSISYQPERDPFLLYTPTQRQYSADGRIAPDHLWVAQYVFFVRKVQRGLIRFDSLEQLAEAGYRLGLVNEYSYSAEFRRRIAGFETRTYPSLQNGFNALAEGEIDLFPADITVGSHIVRDRGYSDKIDYLPQRVVIKPYLMAFSRNSSYPEIESISSRFHAELRRMREAGELAELEKKYRPPLIENVPRPLIFVCEEWQPFEFLKDETPTGIDVDLTRVIMQRLHIPYEIKFYPWSRAWMMVTKGGADAVLSISYKKDREPYLFYTAGQCQHASGGPLPEDYLWMSEYVFFVKKSRTSDISFESYDQLKKAGIRIGKNRDYSYSPEFQAAELSGVTYNDTQSGLLGLLQDEIDLYPMDRTIGLSHLREMGVSDSVTYLPKVLFSKPYLSPFCKLSNFPQLEQVMYAFYSELRILKATGVYDRIRDRHLSDPLPGNGNL